MSQKVRKNIVDYFSMTKELQILMIHYQFANTPTLTIYASKIKKKG